MIYLTLLTIVSYRGTLSTVVNCYIKKGYMKNKKLSIANAFNLEEIIAFITNMAVDYGVPLDSMSQDMGICRQTLFSILKGEKTPQWGTLAKMQKWVNKTKKGLE